MRRIILLAIITGFISCDSKNSKTTNVAQEKVEDNAELIEIFKSDQADRRTENISRDIINYNDSLREARVYELLDSNKVRTSRDYNNAALIFHHGEDSIAYGMAVKLMRKSIEIEPTRNKWLLARAIDRDLLSRNKPQIYGTHYKRLDDQTVVREEMDTTKVADAERIECGVETLAKQREKIKRLNRKKLRELLNDGNSVAELIRFVKQENINDSEYDLSESAINSIGYQLMNQEKKEEALGIFKLNTELYPTSFNVFDSYGECLLALGDKEDAITAYKKSLELNPKNKNAEKVLSEMK